MRIYFDNCCLNRPFDDQSQVRVRLEAQAKLSIQESILAGKVELAWSYIIDYENGMNPFNERKSAIALWRSRAVVDVGETRGILRAANDLCRLGFRSKDALHVACAMAAGCVFFVTTDDLMLKHAGKVSGVRIVDPLTFLLEVEHDY